MQVQKMIDRLKAMPPSATMFIRMNNVLLDFELAEKAGQLVVVTVNDKEIAGEDE